LLKYDYNFHIGDALARTLDAKLTLWSRDPHMAAMCVYWMPLRTFAGALMAFLQPLGHPDYAGPLSSALFAAGTVAVIANAGRDLGRNRLSALLAAAAYGVNPVADATQGAGGETTAAAFTPPTTPTRVVQCVGNGERDGSGRAAKCSLPGRLPAPQPARLRLGPPVSGAAAAAQLRVEPAPASSRAPIRPHICAPRLESAP